VDDFGAVLTARIERKFLSAFNFIPEFFISITRDDWVTFVTVRVPLRMTLGFQFVFFHDVRPAALTEVWHIISVNEAGFGQEVAECFQDFRRTMSAPAQCASSAE